MSRLGPNYTTDEPNRVYMHLGEIVQRLAAVGATDGELDMLFSKSGDLTLLDIALIEDRHFHLVKEVDQ